MLYTVMYTSNSAVHVPMQIKFNYTLRDYQEKFQTLRNGVYPTLSTSNLSKVLLSDFTEDPCLGRKSYSRELSKVPANHVEGLGLGLRHMTITTWTIHRVNSWISSWRASGGGCHRRRVLWCIPSLHCMFYNLGYPLGLFPFL